jgi:hypothetical protein
MVIMASENGARRAVGLIGAANLAGAALVATAGLVAGLLGILFFDNPHASKFLFLLEVAALVIVPLAGASACRSAARSLVASGKTTEGILVALVPSPFLIYVLGRAATVVFHPR